MKFPWWASYQTEEDASVYHNDGIHLPALLRANFIMAQFDIFHEVFETQLGDGMYIAQEQRLRLW